VDSSQYAELFLTESREHVSAINHWLLELEQRGGRGDARSADEALGAIFRSMHTVKGMSATMGYAVVAELSHELETVLDRMRRHELAVTSELMDLLFRAADLLEQAIEGAVAGQEDRDRAAGVLAALKRIAEPDAAQGVPSAGATASAAPSASTSAPNGASASSGGAVDAVPAVPAREPEGHVWTVAAPEGPGVLVRVRLTQDTPLRGVRAFLIVQAIRKVGEVETVFPSLDEIQRDEFDHDFALRLLTQAAAAEIERVARGAGDVAAIQVGEDRVAPRGVAADAPTPAAEPLEAAASRPPTPPAPVPAATAVLPVSERLTTNGDEAPSSPGTAALRQQRHVRIDLRRLDALMNLIGELVITRGRLQQIAGASPDANLQETVTQASRLIGDLRDEIMTSRMVPVWQVFDRFPRLVRDASRALRKQVDFVIEGKEIELDRSMLDEIGDPIVHLLRNAVDHGLEAPDERLRAGKPPTGRLTLSAARDRSAVVIRVTDDGRGIDREKVLQRAREAGLVDTAKSELTDEELLRLVARPGFSTAERVTGISGRGVGVDAVYSRVRALGGAVDMRTVSGQGTTVTLRLPLTLAIVRALLARVRDEIYAVPLTHVSETVELLPDVRRTIRGREVLVLRDDVLPLIRLRGLVGLSEVGPAREQAAAPLEQVVVVEVADRRAGIVVDELAGQQEIVVKQYDAVREGLKIFGGATILSDGSPALIVDVSSVC
jgi:two-component system chemotaxis sensor kinase CheA